MTGVSGDQVAQRDLKLQGCYLIRFQSLLMAQECYMRDESWSSKFGDRWGICLSIVH